MAVHDCKDSAPLNKLHAQIINYDYKALQDFFYKLAAKRASYYIFSY
jgi:hypothetical protein